MENKDQPAFPFVIPYKDNVPDTHAPAGLTKREYFAGLAMQGLIAACDGWTTPKEMPEVAIRSVAAADALLTELNKQP